MKTVNLLVEARNTEGAGVQVEPGPTWRQALLARVRSADAHVSAEEIFAILNSRSDTDTAAALWARNITLPMYCVWKVKYRQLPLRKLRMARLRERCRRYAVVGLVLLTAIPLTGGIAASLVWAAAATFKVVTESAVALPAVEPGDSGSPLSGSDPNPNQAGAGQVESVELSSAAGAMATIVETGYRIQVKAAESAREGLEVVQRLASQGYPAYMTRAVVGNSELFRVRIGPFDTLTAAEETAMQLRSAGYGGAWIAR